MPKLFGIGKAQTAAPNAGNAAYALRSHRTDADYSNHSLLARDPYRGTGRAFHRDPVLEPAVEDSSRLKSHFRHRWITGDRRDLRLGAYVLHGLFPYDALTPNAPGRLQAIRIGALVSAYPGPAA